MMGRGGFTPPLYRSVHFCTDLRGTLNSTTLRSFSPAVAGSQNLPSFSQRIAAKGMRA